MSSDYNRTEEIKQLIRDGKFDIAIKILKELLPEVEREARRYRCELAPWYYNKLALLYRKKKDVDSEIDILSRYLKLNKTGNDSIEDQLAKAEKRKGLKTEIEIGNAVQPFKINKKIISNNDGKNIAGNQTSIIGGDTGE
jgi:hypothetical protein